MCGQHVLDFARANPKRQRTESAMGAGVTVAADNRHTRLSQTKLRSDHVNNPLFVRVDIKELDAEISTVATQSINLFCSNRIGNRQRTISGGNVVIDRGDR